MLTLNYVTEKGYPLDHILTDADKDAIRKENYGKNASYLSLMNEMFGYKNRTIRDLTHGWGGVQVFETPRIQNG